MDRSAHSAIVGSIKRIRIFSDKLCSQTIFPLLYDHGIIADFSYRRPKISRYTVFDNEAFNIPFDFSEYIEKPSAIKLGDSLFSDKGIKLDIKTDKLTACGTLKFNNLSPICYDIMGPFRYVPFMQCRHSVFSMKHEINGQILINGQRYLFRNGIGYIEGDRGYSFPERYIWTQCCFSGGSLMLSVADIPLLGFHFNGIIGVVLLNGEEHNLQRRSFLMIAYMKCRNKCDSFF